MWWKLLCHPKVSEGELDLCWAPQWALQFSDSGAILLAFHMAQPGSSLGTMYTLNPTR